MVSPPQHPQRGKLGGTEQATSRKHIPVTGPRGWFSVFYITRVYRALDCVYLWCVHIWLKTHTVNTTYISAGFLRPASATPPSHTHRAPPRAPAPRGACVCTLQLELVGLSTLPLHASSGPNQKRAAAKRRCQSVPVRTGTERRTTRGPRRHAVAREPTTSYYMYHSRAAASCVVTCRHMVSGHVCLHMLSSGRKVAETALPSKSRPSSACCALAAETSASYLVSHRAGLRARLQARLRAGLWARPRCEASGEA